MPMSQLISREDLFSRRVEDFKEVGHEIRYREQLMVQEFSLSMIAGGVVIGALVPRLDSVVGLIIQVFSTLFFALLTLHLRNINQDRLVAIARKEALRRALDFTLIHQNLDGKKRWSAPRLMVSFARSVAAAWAIWTAISVLTILQPSSNEETAHRSEEWVHRMP